ncbi:MAG TPA: biotin synthase BioB [Solirubrobacteraceae bacterium]|nr:biotin synthase BioB [Solirubrobacteraceae bacterium]HTX10470.1 biotin synthase BioB [Solirubrobacteraceae bacterium]
MGDDIMALAREQVLERGVPLDEAQVTAVLRLPDTRVGDALALAHEVRMRWCGPAVEVEGIISIKTGGCPEDCHFCSQSGRFETPVRAVKLDIPALVQAAHQTAESGATEFCLVAAVRGPDERLMAQVRDAIAAINAEVEINIACSLGILTRAQGEELAALGVHRYNHNLETARSYFPEVVTSHTWEERMETLELVRELGMEVCCGGIIGMGESIAQRAEFASQLATLAPDEVPLNFLDARPGTPFAALPVLDEHDALRAIAAFRLALPRSVLRFAGGRELTLGDDGTRQGMLGGINAMIVGNYLTTLGRSAEHDLDLLEELSMPVKPLAQTR